VAAVVCASLLLFPTLSRLRELWSEVADTSYGHGPLLVILVCWLIYRATDAAERPRGGSWLAVILLALASTAWASAVASVTTSVGLALWPPICVLLLASLYGWRYARRVTLPLLLLYFALPVWGPLNNLVLWPLTVKMASLGVGALQLDALIDGNFVAVPSGRFEIIAGCSGQHFLMVACVIGLTIAHLNELRGRAFLLVAAVAVAFALVMNWIRVVGIIAIGYYTEMRHPLVAQGHLMFGWVLFAAAILLYCLWARWYVNRTPHSSPQERTEHSTEYRPASLGQGVLTASALVALGIGPSWFALAEAQNQSSSQAEQGFSVRMPRGDDQWIGPLLSDSPLRPHFVGFAAERLAAYRSAADGTVAHAYANVYVRQRQGAELVGFDNQLLPEAIWDVNSVAQTAPSGWMDPYAEFTAQTHSGTRWLLRRTYSVAGRPLAGEWQSKVALGLGRMGLRSPAAGLLLLGIECRADCAVERAQMDSAWQRLAPQLLDSVRGHR
jgi:exosortase